MPMTGEFYHRVVPVLHVDRCGWKTEAHACYSIPPLAEKGPQWECQQQRNAFIAAEAEANVKQPLYHAARSRLLGAVVVYATRNTSMCERMRSIGRPTHYFQRLGHNWWLVRSACRYGRANHRLCGSQSPMIAQQIFKD